MMERMWNEMVIQMMMMNPSQWIRMNSLVHVKQLASSKGEKYHSLYNYFMQ